MEEINFFISNISINNIMQYGIWALVPIMLRYYCEKLLAWKNEIDDKIITINHLQQQQDEITNQLNQHLAKYQQRVVTIDNKIDNIVTATERKNNALSEHVNATEETVAIIKNSILAVLSDRLLQSITYFVKQGYTDQLSRLNIHRLYESYLAHGGNSYISQLYEKYRNLPLEEEYFKGGINNG